MLKRNVFPSERMQGSAALARTAVMVDICIRLQICCRAQAECLNPLPPAVHAVTKPRDIKCTAAFHGNPHWLACAVQS